MHAITSQREACASNAHVIIDSRWQDVASWYYLGSFQSIRKMNVPSLYYEHKRRLFSCHPSWQNTRTDGTQAVWYWRGGRLLWLVYPEPFNWGQTSVENTWRHVEHRFPSRFILIKHMAWGETNKPLIFDLYKMRVNSIKIQFKSIVNSASSKCILSGL